jgi:hypothetical protein
VKLRSFQSFHRRHPEEDPGGSADAMEDEVHQGPRGVKNLPPALVPRHPAAPVLHRNQNQN